MTSDLHPGDIIGEDIVVSVFWFVVWHIGMVRGQSWRSLGNGPKLLQEELVVVGLHHHQLVDESHHRHWRMIL